MKNKTKNEYRKFAYFATDDELRNVKQWAKNRRISLRKAKNRACEVLHPQVRAGFVAPNVWNRDCRRQGSWYRQSPEAGNYLIITEVPLENIEGGTRLTLSTFSPPRLPANAEIRRLACSAAYQAERPDKWEQITEEDRLKFALGRDALKQTLDEVPTRDDESFDEVFVAHCANHSNFISPDFYVEENQEICPYSIGDTFHVCSACLELFTIVGRQHRIKYVVPCPGAVAAAQLPIHRYIRVETLL